MTTNYKLQTTNYKFVLVVLIMFFNFNFSFSQKNLNSSKQEKVEKDIQNYIQKNLNNYKLKKQITLNLERTKAHNFSHHNKQINNDENIKAIENLKKFELRKKYFQENSWAKGVFENPDVNSILQTCADGDFELWPAANPFVIKMATWPINGMGQNIVTTGNDFVPISVSQNLNDFNSFATLVSPGNDPIIPAVSRVFNGNRAIKLNLQDGATFDVVTMSRNIIVNENYFDFNYSVILNDPGINQGHSIDQKPFFLVRIYDANDNILRSVNMLTNPQDCSLSSVTGSNISGAMLFTGWKCARINTASLMGQNVRIEFIIADCALGGHFGTVYIDNICNSNCAKPLFGSIDLNPIQTIACPSTAQTICGTFQTPYDSAYSSSLLNVLQGGNVVATINAPTSINTTAGTFCFTVPVSAYGTNPTGNFEFQVVANFTRSCTINFQLDPISDNSANDTGPDVTFNASIVPAFSPISTVCAGSSFILPTTSLNGITGNWSPALNNTTTTTYTFTPNSGQCAINSTLTVTIIPKVTPTFNPISTVCKGAVLNPLPTTSLNGITGTWSPALNNLTTTTYTFTPSAGLCSNTTTLTIPISYISATNDNFISVPINTLLGGNTPSVLTNDLVNNLSTNSSNVITTIVSIYPAITPMPTIDASGVISIPQGVTIGTYSIVYKITQVGCSTNFTTATATIVVTEQTIITPTIVPGIRANSVVSLMDTQSNGKIIIVGSFTKYNSITCLNIARLNTDLTLDTGFVVTGSIPANYRPYDMKVIKTTGPDYNKILLVGNFDGYNGGTNGRGIIRLNPNGTVDTSFNSAYTGLNKGVSGSNSQIRTCFIFPAGHPLAGKILIGGMFTKYNNYEANKLALLNADGSFDTSSTFNTKINTIINPLPIQASKGFTSSPQAIGVQGDGKIIIGGYFNWYNGLNKLHILRLNIDGSHDNTFNPYTGANPGILTNPTFGPYINKLVVQPDNKIIIAGQFTHYNNSSSNNLARLMANGTLDATFAIGTGFNNNVINPSTATKGLVRDLILDTGNSSDWKLYACGDFTGYQGVAVNEIVRINCTLSPGTNNNIGPNSFILSGGGPNGTNNGTVWSMKRQNDGKIIIGGLFTTYDIFSALNVTRIFPSNPSGQARTSTVYYESEPEIDLFAENEVVIYPNPTTGIIRFKTESLLDEKVSVSVFTNLGQKVFEKANLDKEVDNLDLSHLTKGTYFISFSSTTKTITKTLLIK